MEIQKMIQARATGGEGPVWDARTGKMIWLDISAQILNWYDPITGTNAEQKLPTRVSCLVPMGENDFAAATRNGISRIWFDADGTAHDSPLAVVDASPETVSNDGRCDRHGRFAIGMMQKEYRQGEGAFYLCDTDGSSYRFESELTIPNGVDWSADEKTMYATDSRKHCIWAYDYDADTGRIGKRRVLAEILGPDGFTADEEGNLWVAMCGKGKIVCLHGRTGKVLHEIEVPENPYATSCAFGGERMDQLYVTSATWNNPDILANVPDAGSFYVITGLPVRGAKVNPCKIALPKD